MAATADVLLNFQAVDNVSSVAQQIGQSVNSINGQAGGLMNTVSRLSGVFTGLNGLVMGVFGTMGLSTFKEMTYGTATAREQIKQLFETVAGSTKDVNSEAYKLWDTMDKMTNHGYVSLDQLAQATNVLGLSTGASVEQMSMLAPVINEIGNRAILMGYDANRTQQLMNNVAQGLNGNTRMLNVAFGITADKLKEQGWSGKADDIETYTKALKGYLNIDDDVGEHLDNTQGKVIALQKRFRIAGRNLGNYMLPPINAIIDKFTELNAESDDLLASLIIIGTGAMSGFASIIPTINPLLQLHGILKDFNNSKVDNNKFDGVCDDAGQAAKCIAQADARMGLFRRTYSGVTTFIKAKAGFLNPLNIGFIRNSKYVNASILKLREWISVYLSAEKLKKFDSFFGTSPETFDKADEMKARLKSTKNNWKANGADEVKDEFFLRSQLALKGEEAALRGNTKSLRENLLARKSNIVQKVRGIFFSEASAVAHGEEALAEGADTVATEGNTISKIKNWIATQGGIKAMLKSIAIRIKSTAVKIVETAKNWALALSEMGIAWPILLIVGALVSLILILDQIGKSLGWWTNWKTMLDAIVNGLKRLWSAFINNPNVQGFIKDIQGLFAGVGGVINWVAEAILQLFGIEDNGEQVDAVRMIIDVFGALGRVLGDIVNVFKAVFGAIYTVTAPIVSAIVWVLGSIICILVGCSPGIIPALNSLNEVFRRVFNGLASFVNNPIGTIVRAIRSWQSLLFSVAKNIGQSIWNGLNSVLGGLPQRVWQIFWNMINNLKQIPNQIFNTAQQIGTGIWDGMDSAISGATGGLIHLPNANVNNSYARGKARSNAQTVGNVNKNYNNANNARNGHIFNISQGAIQLDARNLTTKESKQVMINALEGLTSYETVHTKKASRQK